MSLLRSFTTRRAKTEGSSSVQIGGPAASQRAGKPVFRSQISSPVALLSSTNSLSFEAPDIVGTSFLQQNTRKVSSGSSAASSHSGDDSDESSASITSNTDASSLEDVSPITPEAEHNHLSCYFKPGVNTTIRNSSPGGSTRASFDAPVIPQRVPSHSKKAHEQLHRKRSVQRLMSPPRSVTARSSTDMFESAEAPRENPFGKELAQLDEVAEELTQTVHIAKADEDVALMRVKGLAHYEASDYISEIYGLIETYLAEAPSWI